jgi:hypothetical protein
MRLRRLCFEIFAFRRFFREPICRLLSAIADPNTKRRSLQLCFRLVDDLTIDKPIEVAADLSAFSGGFIGLQGFEPWTSCTRGRRSTKLSHSPNYHQLDWRFGGDYVAHLRRQGK